MNVTLTSILSAAAVIVFFALIPSKESYACSMSHERGVVDSFFVPPYTTTVAVVIFVTCYEGVSWTDSFAHVTNVLVGIILSLKVFI